MTKQEMCEKIRALYSEIWDCGFDVNAEWDEGEKTWVVELKREDWRGKHFVALGGLHLEQLRPNIERTQA